MVGHGGFAPEEMCFRWGVSSVCCRFLRLTATGGDPLYPLIPEEENGNIVILYFSSVFFGQHVFKFFTFQSKYELVKPEFQSLEDIIFTVAKIFKVLPESLYRLVWPIFFFVHIFPYIQNYPFIQGSLIPFKKTVFEDHSWSTKFWPPWNQETSSTVVSNNRKWGQYMQIFNPSYFFKKKVLYLKSKTLSPF